MNTGFNNQNNWQSPFSASSRYYPAPRFELLRVRGEESAKNFRMAPNSEALLVDETAPLIWHVQTDSSGFLTATPYLISPYKPQEVAPVDLNNLAERVKQLEDKYAQQSNTSTKRTKHQQSSQQSNDEGNK